ncbi:Ribosome maturation factor RimP [Frankliniella fusca]|uniref:Ribosome maturation factor RimP n=1 Tax=Frankliniella fusca TaxID=407009 RepID=A0AAE1HXQ8_9NEOP|nr:Ribosome maturation factor RimP [Frankliniella fusca]
MPVGIVRSEMKVWTVKGYTRLRTILVLFTTQERGGGKERVKRMEEIEEKRKEQVHRPKKFAACPVVTYTWVGRVGQRGGGQGGGVAVRPPAQDGDVPLFCHIDNKRLISPMCHMWTIHLHVGVSERRGDQGKIGKIENEIFGSWPQSNSNSTACLRGVNGLHASSGLSKKHSGGIGMGSNPNRCEPVGMLRGTPCILGPGSKRHVPWGQGSTVDLEQWQREVVLLHRNAIEASYPLLREWCARQCIAPATPRPRRFDRRTTGYRQETDRKPSWPRQPSARTRLTSSYFHSLFSQLVISKGVVLGRPPLPHTVE